MLQASLLFLPGFLTRAVLALCRRVLAVRSLALTPTAVTALPYLTPLLFSL